jgi:hypothetical protein
MFAMLLSMGMLLQGSFASTDQGGDRVQVSVRKCCRAEKAEATSSCHIRRCCRTSEEVPAPVSVRVATGTEMALVVPALVLDYAPLAARPPTGYWQLGVRYVPSVPLYQRYCSILI